MAKLKLWLRFGAGEPIEKIEDLEIETDAFEKSVIIVTGSDGSTIPKFVTLNCKKDGEVTQLTVLSGSIILMECTESPGQ
jgi:hypothetical protein